ncbi:MAG: thermonuclease family protein [Erysipelotrichaceae bacterium]|nr:thermonuclease family protein [Erysipelotrichaceae bacterium]
MNARETRRLVKRQYNAIFFAFVIIFALIALHLYLRPEAGPKEGLYKIDYVSDGDTLIVNIEGEKKFVRLIGIDCPESVHPDETKNTPEGKLAAEHTRELAAGHSCYLEYDSVTIDDYGRTLAYVWLDDGTFLNEQILADGYAELLTIPPNVRYSNRFQKAYHQAREEGKGLFQKN